MASAMSGSGSEPGEQSPLAVLMPAYNEQENIESAVQEVCRTILDKVPNSYLIVVDDGSTDDTGVKLDRLSQTDHRVHVIHKPNAGHGPALVRALNEADSTYVFLIDSDMQIPLECFDNFWQTVRQPGVDGVFGIRKNRHDPAVRVLLSGIISCTLSGIFKVKLTDPNVPCKLLKRMIWKQLYERINDDTLMAPSLVISIYAESRKYKIINIPILHRARAHGRSSLHLNSLISFCWSAFRQLMNLKEQIV